MPSLGKYWYLGYKISRPITLHATLIVKGRDFGVTKIGLTLFVLHFNPLPYKEKWAVTRGGKLQPTACAVSILFNKLYR